MNKGATSRGRMGNSVPLPVLTLYLLVKIYESLFKLGISAPIIRVKSLLQALVYPLR
jgi:hypothetical protein